MTHRTVQKTGSAFPHDAPANIAQMRLLRVDGILQARASAELGGLGSGNLDLLASARVARLTGSAVCHNEGAETDDLHLVALLQSAGDRLDGGVDRVASLATRKAHLVGDCRNELAFIHSHILQ